MLNHYVKKYTQTSGGKHNLIETKTGMLLFCKEQRANVYALYFVEFGTMTQRSPCVHRFYAKRKQFVRMLPGGCYTLALKHLYITQFTLDSEFMISEPYYALLMELREVAFADTPSRLPRRFDPLRYYTFSEVRSLLEYSEPPLRSALRVLFTYACAIFSALIPAALYFLFLSFILGSPIRSQWSAPILAICILPTMFAMMYALYTFAESLLLRWSFTKYYLLQQYALRSAGARRQITMPASIKKRLLYISLACIGVFAISTLSLLIK